MREIFDPRDFTTWMSNAKHGDRCCYHFGLIMSDRPYAPSGKPMAQSAFSTLANVVWSAQTAGYVALVQKRIDPMICQYIAVKL